MPRSVSAHTVPAGMSIVHTTGSPAIYPSLNHWGVAAARSCQPSTHGGPRTSVFNGGVCFTSRPLLLLPLVLSAATKGYYVVIGLLTSSLWPRATTSSVAPFRKRGVLITFSASSVTWSKAQIMQTDRTGFEISRIKKDVNTRQDGMQARKHARRGQTDR